jgi:hypothetical protein
MENTACGTNPPARGETIKIVGAEVSM